MEELFKEWTNYLASGVEISGSVVIAFAAIQATARFLRAFFQRNLPPYAMERIRLNLGRWLALALEFELAADILRTAVAPTWNEIGQLAAIVVLRTALNFFLEREIEKATRTEGHVPS